MSHFYAEIEGARGMASRCGSKASGHWGHIRGWRGGVKVNAWYRESDDADVFPVYMTHGSGGGQSDHYLGAVVVVDGQPTWEPAPTE